MSDHGLYLANDYYNLFGGKNYLHIRSTGLFNVGKYIFPKESITIKNWNLQHISNYVKKWTHLHDSEEIIKHLNHLINHAQLENFYNYNPLDLLFISYRMIQRHSGVVYESDIAFNTMILLNSRHILDLLLSYPIEDRKNNKLFQSLMGDLWPILNYWDINKPVDLLSKYNSTSNALKLYKKINNQLLLELISTFTTQQTPLTCIKSENGYLYKFSDLKVNANENYQLRIDLSNLSDFEKIKFRVKFFYKNEKGRNSISVTSNFQSKELDILDLYGDNEIIIDNNDIGPNKELFIKVEHLQSTNSMSWIEASRLWIGDFDIYSESKNSTV